MLAPIRVVAPASLPLTLAEAKAQLRVDHTDDDLTIEAYIEAATDYLDGWAGILGRCLVEQSWRQDFADFGQCLRLPLAPVLSVTAVTYFDGDGVQQTLAGSVYRLLTDGRGPMVALAPDQAWPSTQTRADAVSVTFVAGYPAIPPAIKNAMRMLITHWYENRSAVVVGTAGADVPMSVRALLFNFGRQTP